MTKRINVVTTAYEGNDFPEAAHWVLFLGARLTEMYPAFEINVTEGPRTEVHVYGDDMGDDAIRMEVLSNVKQGLWDEFCDHGYKAYS